MTTFTLTSVEAHDAVLALQIAADTYDKDARAADHYRIRDQFQRQAARARKLAEKLDGDLRVHLDLPQRIDSAVGSEVQHED